MHTYSLQERTCSVGSARSGQGSTVRCAGNVPCYFGLRLVSGVYILLLHVEDALQDIRYPTGSTGQYSVYPYITGPRWSNQVLKEDVFLSVTLRHSFSLCKLLKYLTGLRVQR
jgi:hypothetical protein